MGSMFGCLILLKVLDKFITQVASARRDAAILSWKRWLNEDLSSRPFQRLRPDLVPPAPYLVCDPKQTPGGSGILVQPSLIDAQFRKAWLPFFSTGRTRSCYPPLPPPKGFWILLVTFWSRLLSLTCLYFLVKTCIAKKSTSGGLDGWSWNELKALPLSWYVGLAWVLGIVEDTGVWPDGLLDAYITMIPKADGGSTPLGQRPLCVLPVIYRLWASVRLGHIQQWFYSWVPDTVFSAGKGVSSVDAWYATSLDIEEVLSGAVDGHVHMFVADVIKYFDTVDRGILDCALGRLGFPDWFRRVYFSYHADVRLRFKLAIGLGEAWTRDGGIPQGCPLSMGFIVALYVPWCRYLSNQHGVTPQLYADNLKCTTTHGHKQFEAARFTDQYIRAVGQEASPSKCVLRLTSKATGKRMKNWSISAGNKGWGSSWMFVIWEVILIFLTGLGLVHLLVGRFALPLRFVWWVHSRLFFLRLVSFVRTKFLPAGLHGAEGSHIFFKKLNS